MSAAKMGAMVLYCGHDASFVADVYRVGDCNVIVANGSLDTKGNLQRPAAADCTHHVSDAQGGVWKPNRGLFAVPEKACTELKPGQVEKWYGSRLTKKGGRS